MEKVISIQEIRKHKILYDELARLLKRYPDKDINQVLMEVEEMSEKKTGPRMLGDKRQIGVFVNAELYKKAQIRAIEEGVKIGRLIEKALEVYLDKEGITDIEI